MKRPATVRLKSTSLALAICGAISLAACDSTIGPPNIPTAINYDVQIVDCP